MRRGARLAAIAVTLAGGLVTISGCSGDPTPMDLSGPPIGVQDGFHGSVDWRLDAAALGGEQACPDAASCSVRRAFRSADGDAALAVVTGSDSTRLVGVDVRSGAVSWRAPWPDDLRARCQTVGDTRWACTTAADVPGPAGHLRILARSDGHSVADRHLQARGPVPTLTVHGTTIWTVSAVLDRRIFPGGTTQWLYVAQFDADGHQDWTRAIEVESADSPHILVDGQRLALADPGEGTVHSPGREPDQIWLDPSTGKVVGGEDDPIVSALAGTIVTHRKDEPIVVDGTELPGSADMYLHVPGAIDDWQDLPLFAETRSSPRSTLYAFAAANPSTVGWTRNNAAPLGYCDDALLLHVRRPPAPSGYLARVDVQTGENLWRIAEDRPWQAWCGKDTIIVRYGQDVTVRSIHDGSVIRTVTLGASGAADHWNVVDADGTAGLLFSSTAGLALVS